MLLNQETNQYETGDDANPFDEEDDDPHDTVFVTRQLIQHLFVHNAYYKLLPVLMNSDVICFRPWLM
jgi:hypothetical protein